MNEYWQSEDRSSFCFCRQGEWYQIKCADPTVAQWSFLQVTMDRGLPASMHDDYYNETGLEAMLSAVTWSEDELQQHIDSQLNRVD